MPAGNANWIECPSWDPLDPYRDTKIMCWHILIDAAKKSVMSNDLRSGGTAKVRIPWHRDAYQAREVLRDMVSAREWLLSEEEYIPGESIKDGVRAGIGCRVCLKVLNIRRMVIFELLRHLWLLREDNMREAIRKLLVAARATVERDKRYNASRAGVGGRAGRPRTQGSTMVKDLQTALRVLDETNKELGV